MKNVPECPAETFELSLRLSISCSVSHLPSHGIPLGIPYRDENDRIG